MDPVLKRTTRQSVPLNRDELCRLTAASEASGLPIARLMRLASLRLAEDLTAPGVRPAGLVSTTSRV